jgi:tetratricopeptide (TPR) repeat protein
MLGNAKHLLKSGRAADAVSLLQKYTAEHPSDPDGPFWLGLAFDETGEPKQAIWAYSRCLDLATKSGMDSPELRVNIGNTLLKLDRPVDAIFNYKRAIAIDSKLPHAHFNLGRALLDQGDTEAALAEFNRFYELGGSDTALFFYKALAFRTLGKRDDAKVQLELFLNSLADTPKNQPAKKRSQAILRELSQTVNTIEAPAH